MSMSVFASRLKSASSFYNMIRAFMVLAVPFLGRIPSFAPHYSLAFDSFVPQPRESFKWLFRLGKMASSLRCVSKWHERISKFSEPLACHMSPGLGRTSVATSTSISPRRNRTRQLLLKLTLSYLGPSEVFTRTYGRTDDRHGRA